MDNFGYMLAAFSVIWVALCAYIFILGQKQKQLRRDIDQLKTMLRQEPK